MCAYGLSDPDSQIPVLKPTGLAVSHADMSECVCTCPGHSQHQSIAGRTNEGVRSFADVQESFPTVTECHEVCAAEAAQDPEKVKSLLKRLHNI